MSRRASLSAEIETIIDQLSRATAHSAPQVRDLIDQRLGIILASMSGGRLETMAVEGARILCYLYLHDLEAGRPGSEALAVALSSLRRLGGQ